MNVKRFTIIYPQEDKKSLRIIMGVKGAKGAITLSFRQGEKMDYEFGIHSRKSMYRGHTHQPVCDVLGDHCYYDGSHFTGEELYKLLMDNDENCLYSELEKEYNRRFKTKVKENKSLENKEGKALKQGETPLLSASSGEVKEVIVKEGK